MEPRQLRPRRSPPKDDRPSYGLSWWAEELRNPASRRTLPRIECDWCSAWWPDDDAGRWARGYHMATRDCITPA